MAETPRIDAHQHYWQLSRGDYFWLTPELGAIYRDFLPADLAPKLSAAGIDKTVLVQAAPTLAETRFMLSLADQDPSIGAVVGWVDMEASEAPEQLDAFAEHPAFRGIRPMIEVIEDDDWMLAAALEPAYRGLIDRGLCFDALIAPRHLDRLLTLVRRYPELRVVIDHGAKPQIRDGAFDRWAEAIAALAENSNVFCKLSGLVTEAPAEWTAGMLKPYVDHLIGVFGPRRVMWGSDWPVLNLASDYATWHATALALIQDLVPEDRNAVLGGTAARFYTLAATLGAEAHGGAHRLAD